MSRLVLCALLLVGVHTAADAQTIRGYGVELGIASTNVNYDGYDAPGDIPERSTVFDFERRYGFAVAGFVEWMDHPNVSLLTKATFIQKGFAIEHEARDAQNNPDGTFRISTQINYLSVAVPLKIRADIGPGAPFISIGPRMDIKVGGDPSGTGSTAEAYETPVIGWDASAGFEVIRPDHVDLLAEVVYSRDRTNSLPDNDFNTTAHHNAVSFMIGLRWK